MALSGKYVCCSYWCFGYTAGVFPSSTRPLSLSAFSECSRGSLNMLSRTPRHSPRHRQRSCWVQILSSGPASFPLLKPRPPPRPAAFTAYSPPLFRLPSFNSLLPMWSSFLPMSKHCLSSPVSFLFLLSHCLHALLDSAQLTSLSSSRLSPPFRTTASSLSALFPSPFFPTIAHSVSLLLSLSLQFYFSLTS